MPSTYTSLLHHLVFSTKYREPSIDVEWRPRFHAYLAGTVKGLGAVPLDVGGVADHVHLLVGIKPTHCLADFVRELKKASTAWVVREVGRAEFRWQEGYAAFSVGASVAPSVREYIARQEEHHRVRPFREELVQFLRKAGVEYEERYLD